MTEQLRQTPRIARAIRLAFWLSGLLAAAMAPPVYGQSTALLSEGRALYHSGQYEKCRDQALGAIAAGDNGVTWWQLAIQSQLALGEYAAAGKTLDEALELHTWSLPLRWLGIEVRRYQNQPEKADELELEVETLLRQSPWRYRDVDSQLVMAKLLLGRAADPKLVLERVLRPLQKENDDVLDVHVAIGRLALDKQDFALAAEAFQQAARTQRDHPEVQHCLALAYESSDAEQMQAALTAALEVNPRYAPALLTMVEEHIAAERYDDAGKILDEIEKTNAHLPLLWTFRAVIAHLVNQPAEEQRAYERALAVWSTNPEVDHVLGRELSRKYRFAEGAAYQRKALEKDAEYLPARLQLSQDLLRLGQEEEGWQLANHVYATDPYQVLAYNLTELRDRLSRFNTRYGDGIHLRMEPRESRVFGKYALDLLERARRELSQKYQVELKEPVLVEIFPRQADFAIRTFGLPGGEGFLGVCFGNVITANSPPERTDNTTNWQATLWHEFCHVVTLNKTHNKMPRWLSEGISVYEERQASPLWGQRMTPRYREMLLSDDLVPVSELSGAFLRPESPEHLQFAYYESSLVVEWLVETHGLPTLNRLLDDLGLGLSIDEALTRHVGAREFVDSSFAAYARQRATAFGAGADWTTLPETVREADDLREFLQEHPRNFWAMRRLAEVLARNERPGRVGGQIGANGGYTLDNPQPPGRAQRNTEGGEGAEGGAASGATTPSAGQGDTVVSSEAVLLWQQLLELCPEDAGAGSARAQLARYYQRLQDTQREREMLIAIAQRNGDALDVRLRLLQLAKLSVGPAADGQAAQNAAGGSESAERAENTAATDDQAADDQAADDQAAKSAVSEQQPGDAVRWAREIIQINPFLSAAREVLAEDAAGRGELIERIQEMEALLELTPLDPAALHFELAQSWRSWDAQSAKRHLLQALEIAPRYQPALQMLYELHEAAGSPAVPTPQGKPPLRALKGETGRIGPGGDAAATGTPASAPVESSNDGSSPPTDEEPSELDKALEEIDEPSTATPATPPADADPTSTPEPVAAPPEPSSASPLDKSSADESSAEESSTNDSTTNDSSTEEPPSQPVGTNPASPRPAQETKG